MTGTSESGQFDRQVVVIGGCGHVGLPLDGPASAITLISAVHPAISAYCQTAGWPSSHHGTTLARNEPAWHGTGDGARRPPAPRPAPPQAGCAPQNTTPTPANTARSTTA